MSKLQTLGLAILLAINVNASAATVFSADLSGPNEFPANASPGTGFAMVTIDDVADTMRIQAIFGGLVGTSTAAHIHCCTDVPGVATAGVATTTPVFPDFPLGVTAGTYDHLFDLNSLGTYNSAFVTANGGTADGAEAALLAGFMAGTSYFNIHSSVFGGGEIRGFLLPAAAVAPVPEPQSYVMLLAGLGIMGFIARRRRRKS